MIFIRDIHTEFYNVAQGIARDLDRRFGSFFRRFTWRSAKILYTAIVFLAVFTITVYNVLRLLNTGINSTKMSKSIRDCIQSAENPRLDLEKRSIRLQFPRSLMHDSISV